MANTDKSKAKRFSEGYRTQEATSQLQTFIDYAKSKVMPDSKPEAELTPEEKKRRKKAKELAEKHAADMEQQQK